MPGRGDRGGKKGLGNTCIPSYVPYLHLPQVAMVTRLCNTIMNIDKQADVGDLITCQRRN